MAADLPATAAIFAYKTRGHSFTYYGGRSLLRVRSPADAAAALGRAAPTAVLVKRRHLEKIRAHLTAPACIWWQSPSGRVLSGARRLSLVCGLNRYPSPPPRRVRRWLSHATPDPRWGWRTVFFVGILPAFFVLWVRRNVEEPEVWKAQQRARLAGGAAAVTAAAGRFTDMFRGPMFKLTAVVTLMNLDTGRSFCYGRLAPDVLRRSFGTDL